MNKKGTSADTQRRIRWIDGLRGVGCLCIFFHHFLMGYYPATYWGTAAESRIRWGLDTRLADLPFFFWINGNFWVCVYLFISGMVVANKSLGQETEHKTVYLLRSFVRRYLTLLLPIFLGELFMCLGNIALPNNVIPDLGQPLSLFQYLKSTFWSVLFVCDKSVMGSLWTMQAIFLGGLLILLVRVLFRNKGIQILILLAAMAGFLQCWKVQEYWYFAPVMAGGIFGILLPLLEKIPLKKCMGSLLLILGCYLAAYPSGTPAEGWYGILPDSPYGPFFFHFIGAVLFIWGISVLEVVQRIFSTAPALWLGKISYPFYVFHIFFIKLSSLAAGWAGAVAESYWVRPAAAAVCSLGLCLATAYLYSRYADPLWRRVVSKI
ncbi:MAG: acyltransferase [Lachnospiraceae bacterium]|nr:acyltransferase [Lachnospiraceae bacterium]